MATLIQELDKRIKGSLSQTEDWWRLMRDDGTGGLFVEHEWSHTDLKSLHTDEGKDRISIKVFLESDHPWAAGARNELQRLLDKGIGG